MAPYVRPADYGGQVGGITEARVDKIVRTLVEAGAVAEGSLKPDDLVSFGISPK
jgi:NitT/TauT family transport system substrate-binding protein